jgi:8-oxo-dGTP diphosphatase
MSYVYEYPHAAVCVDIILLYHHKTLPEILLIQRKNNPFMNCWALPGGFIEMEETLMESALRELKEETGIELSQLEQFATYGDPGRDPRERNISIVYFSLLKNKLEPQAGDDARKARWFPIKDIPDMAFDHNKIIQDFISKTEM